MAKKKGNGEGSIGFHKKSGLYMARYTLETATGVKRKTLYAKTRKEVSEKLTEVMAQAQKGITADAGAMTVGAFLARLLNVGLKTPCAVQSGTALTTATNLCAASI